MSAAPPSSTFPAVAKAGWFQRLVWGACAVTLAGLLITAWRLRPDPYGLGTHQQLGLPPCTALIVWGIRCPACGMTTSWALYTDGRWITSLMTNAGGFVFALIATVAAPYLGYLAVLGRRAPSWAVPMLAIILGMALVITLVDWTLRLSL